MCNEYSISSYCKCCDAYCKPGLYYTPCVALTLILISQHEKNAENQTAHRTWMPMLPKTISIGVKITPCGTSHRILHTVLNININTGY